MTGFFITGTDTGIGKTWVSIALMRGLQSQGLSVLGMKPVATGCHWIDGALRNEDAELLLQQASMPLAYEKINPYAYEPPVSPHIAARLAGRPIELDLIVRRCRELEALADVVVVEGIGGWEVPLNPDERVCDLALALKLPVILVVGMRLGCLNHALLTHQAIVRSGVELAGWFANQPQAGMLFLEENIETLKSRLESPYLGLLPHVPGGNPLLQQASRMTMTPERE